MLNFRDRTRTGVFIVVWTRHGEVCSEVDVVRTRFRTSADFFTGACLFLKGSSVVNIFTCRPLLLPPALFTANVLPAHRTRLSDSRAAVSTASRVELNEPRKGRAARFALRPRPRCTAARTARRGSGA